MPERDKCLCCPLTLVVLLPFPSLCFFFLLYLVQNPGNPVAEDMFMKIAKAYEALTDAQVRGVVLPLCRGSKI